MTGAALDQAPQPRICRTDGCETVLSRFNAAVVCASCSNRLEIGGLIIPLPPQQRFDARPPAPTRPTTEGGITLTGPVTVTPERPLAEMLAKPATAREKAPAPKCAECGEPLPKHHTGWLCRLCTIAAEQQSASPTAPKGAATAAVGSTTPVAPEAAQTGAPTAQREHQGHKRKFDWEELTQAYLDGATQAELVERYGIGLSSVKRAIKRTLGEEAAIALGHSRRGPRRAAETTEPAQLTPKPEAPHERSTLEARVEQIKLLIDQNATERTHLNDQARQLLEEWGDINWRLSKLSDEAA